MPRIVQTIRHHPSLRVATKVVVIALLLVGVIFAVAPAFPLLAVAALWCLPTH